MNYEVRRHGDKWKVYENRTQQYITTKDKKEIAESIAESLNNGAGFDGETPRFFINESYSYETP